MPRHGSQAKRLFWGDFPALIEVRQPRDPRGRQNGQRVPDTATRDHAIRRDLGERNQDKGALEQPGVRQCQALLVDPDIVIVDQIEVETSLDPQRRS